MSEPTKQLAGILFFTAILLISLAALGTATAAVAGNAGNDASIEIEVQPENTLVAQPITGPPTVKVTDNEGDGLEGETVVVTEVGGYVFDGGDTEQTTDSDGIAEFDDLQINEQGTYQLEFEAPDIAESITSNEFNITEGGAIIIVGQDTETHLGDVEGEDQFRRQAEVLMDARETDATDILVIGDYTEGDPCPGSEGWQFWSSPEGVIYNGECSAGGGGEIDGIDNSTHSTDFLDDPSEIKQLTYQDDLSNYAMLATMTQTDAAGMSGGLTEAQVDALGEISDEIGDFISAGGAFFGMEQSDIPKEKRWKFLETVGEFDTEDIGNVRDLKPGPAAEELGIEPEAMETGPYHEAYIDFPGFMDVIAFYDEGTGYEDEAAVIGGLDITIRTPEESELVSDVPEWVYAGDPIIAEVEVTDDNGLPVDGAEVDVAEVGGYVLDAGNTTATTNDEGIATFDDLEIHTPGHYQLEFDTEQVDETEISSEFEVRIGPPDHIDIITQPNETYDVDPIEGPPLVRVFDQVGNPVPDTPVDTAVVNGSYDGGTTQVNTNDSAYAEFDDLRITDPGTYQINFTAGDAEAVSEEFNITRVDSFEIEIDRTNSPFPEGDDLILHARVSNPSGTDDTQSVTYSGHTTATQEVSLDPGQTDTEIFIIPTEVGDAGGYDITLETRGDSAHGAIQILQLAHFDVTITDTNSPVAPGEPIVADVTINNTGDLNDTQQIRLDVDGVATGVASTNITVEEYEPETIQLAWPTDGQSSGDYTLNVSSADDNDQATVSIQEPARIEVVDIDTATQTIPSGEILEYTVTVANLGDLPGEDTVTVFLEGEEIESEPFSLDGGEQDSFTLTWETSHDRTGQNELRAQTTESEQATDVMIEPSVDPIAAVEIEYDPDEPLVDQDVTFEPVIAEGDAPVSDYEWAIDGEVVSQDEIYEHAFADAGDFDVSLIITDETGSSAGDEVEVTVISEDERAAAEIEDEPEEDDPGDCALFGIDLGSFIVCWYWWALIAGVVGVTGYTVRRRQTLQE